MFKKGVKRYLIIFFVTLSIVLCSVPLSHKKEVKALTAITYNTIDYTCVISQTSSTYFTVTWRPNNLTSLSYINRIVINFYNGQTQVGALNCYIYGDGEFTFQIAQAWDGQTYYSYQTDYRATAYDQYYTQLLVNTLNTVQASTTNIETDIQDIESNLYSLLLQYGTYASNQSLYLYNIQNMLNSMNITNEVNFISYPAYMNYHDHADIVSAEQGLTNQLGISIKDYPVLKINTLYPNTDTSQTDGYSVASGDSVTFMFWSNHYTNNFTSTWPSYFDLETTRIDIGYGYKYIVTATNNGPYSAPINLIFPVDRKVIPIYTGYIEYCPEEILHIFGLSSPEEQSTHQTADDIDQVNNDFTQTIEDYDQLEQDLTDDFNDNLDNINFTINPGTYFGSNFVNSMSWVTTQFNSLITSNPFGDILTFSLTLGIALLLIGRIL